MAATTVPNCANCCKLLTDEDGVTRIPCLNPNKPQEVGQVQDGVAEGISEGPAHEEDHNDNVGHQQHEETLELSVVTLSQTGELFQVDVEEAQQLIDSGVLRIETMESSTDLQQDIVQLSSAIEDPSEKDKDNSEVSVDHDIPVVEALSAIFGIPLVPGVAAGMETSSAAFAWRKEDNCALCLKCGDIVRILYSTFQELNALRAEESYVSKGIKQFVSKINSANSEDGNGPCDSVPTTQTKKYESHFKAKTTCAKKARSNVKEKSSKKIASKIDADAKNKKRIKLEEDSEDDNMGVICADNISELSSDSNSLSDLEKEVADTEGAVRTTRTSARRRIVKKQLSDYEELESSEEEVPPDTFDDDEDNDPNFDAAEEIQDIKVLQEDVQLRRVSDICVQVLEYKEEDLQVDTDGKFICPECNKPYIGLKTLNKHVLIHKLKKAPTCPKCNIKFETLDLLHYHMTSQHNPATKMKRLPGRPPRRKNKLATTKQDRLKLRTKSRKHKCSTCDAEFANQSLLTQHETEHGPVPCLTCHKEFPSPSILMRHEKDVHNSKKEINYFCIECGEIFSGLEPLAAHFAESHNENLNFCTECGKSFTGAKFLLQHLKETHQMPSENIKVEQLSDNESQDEEGTEESFDPLREPGERVKKCDPTPYKCSHCDEEFLRKKQLDVHLLFHNGDEPQHECNICSKRFFQLKGLKRHLRLHTTDNPHVCVQCDRIFPSAGHLKRHRETSHSGKRNNNCDQEKRKKGSPSSKDVTDYKCNDCDKVFTRKEYLRLHQRIHTGEKPYQCTEPDCGKTFRDPRNLAQHLVTHKTDRPFCCSICGVTFKRAHHLNDHEGTHREDVVRPFVCSLQNCGKAFKLRKHLISHELVHSGTKDHICEICGKAFNRKDNLRQHINKVHGKDSNFSDLIRVPTNEVETNETQVATLVPVALPDKSNNITTTIQILPNAPFTYIHL